MSKDNKPILIDKTNTEAKLNKKFFNNENFLFQFNTNNSVNSQNSKTSSKKNQSEKHRPLKFEIDSKLNNKTKINILGPLKGEKDPEKQLLYYFKDKKIYIEIFNGNLNASPIFYNLLLKYKIIQCKKLSKKIDYIVFKDGHLKTKKYAVLNNIKMVNPLWIDDKINNHIFKDDKEYEIKTNFGDIVLREKYEKNKENNKDEEDFLTKNYDLELEAEYDTEYANMIDKLRENKNTKKDNESEIEIALTNEEDYDGNLNEMKENETEEIRKKRISSSNTNNKLENRKTINNKKNNIFENEKDNKYLLKDKSKNHQKKGANKNKKNKSVSPNSNKKESIKKTTKITENQKKLVKNENNYILELNQDNGKVLSLPNKPEMNFTSKKVNIMTYKLEEKEIQCLKTLTNFEYKGNLDNLNDTDKIIYENSIVIILEQKKVIYDWRMYEFLLDKKIIVDFTSFLLEFINGDKSENIDSCTIIEKINEISMNNEFYFFNKKKRMQKRTFMQSLNIIDNILSKDKKEQFCQQQNDGENKIYFMINQDINDNEKKILQKLLKNYLKGNIINTNMPKKKSRSFVNQIKLNLEKITKKTKKNSLEVINENDLSNKENNKNEIENLEYNNEGNNDNGNSNNNNISNEIECKNNEEQKIEGIYFIAKDKFNNIKLLKKVKYFKGIISYKYIYDSFSNGQLLDLGEQDIFEKYKLQ